MPADVSSAGRAIVVVLVALAAAAAALVVTIAVAIRWLSAEHESEREVDLRADLAAMAAAQAAHRESAGSYATTYDQLEEAGYRSVGVNSSEIGYATESGFCMQATNGSIMLHVTESLPPQPGPCPPAPSSSARS